MANFSIKNDIVVDSVISRNTIIIPTVQISQVPPVPSGKIVLNSADANLYYSSNNTWNNAASSSSPIGASVYSNINLPIPLLQYTVR